MTFSFAFVVNNSQTAQVESDRGMCVADPKGLVRFTNDVS